VGAEADLALIKGEMGDAAAELEQAFARVAVAFVLLDGIGDGLLGEAVLQLEGGQAVDENGEVERAGGLLAAVKKLAGDAETVERIQVRCFDVAGARTSVEEVDVVRTVVDAAAEDVDGAAAGDFALQAGEEFAAGRVIGLELGGFGGYCLEGGKLVEVDRVFAVVLGGIAEDVMAGASKGACGSAAPRWVGAFVRAAAIRSSGPRSVVSVVMGLAALLVRCVWGTYMIAATRGLEYLCAVTRLLRGLLRMNGTRPSSAPD
jgi:hypothetical protein